MTQKTVLLVDDEQGFLEALRDALEHEGHRVLTATTASEALEVLDRETVHLATVDVMMPAGPALAGKVDSHETGVMLCEIFDRDYPDMGVFCLSVTNDDRTIRRIQRAGARFLRKGETPLRTVLSMIRSRLTGVAYSTDQDRSGGRH